MGKKTRSSLDGERFVHYCLKWNPDGEKPRLRNGTHNHGKTAVTITEGIITVATTFEKNTGDNPNITTARLRVSQQPRTQSYKVPYCFFFTIALL